MVFLLKFQNHEETSDKPRLRDTLPSVRVMKDNERQELLQIGRGTLMQCGILSQRRDTGGIIGKI